MLTANRTAEDTEAVPVAASIVSVALANDIRMIAKIRLARSFK